MTIIIKTWGIAMLFVIIPLIGAAQEMKFKTSDSLKSFVYTEYPLGDDYFINGNRHTDIFRCILTKEREPFEGVAFSEISIWGNRTGPWEVFRKEPDGKFIYVETKHYTNTSCLESCRSDEYLASGQCAWRRGWPKQP